VGTQPNKSETRFLRYIHGFRGVAIISVVATHVTEALEWNRTIPFDERVIHAIIRNGTIPFVFVAGFLFQHLSATFRYRTYLLTKLKNVIVPYLICSLPVLANQFFRRVEIYADLPPGQPMEALAITIKALLTGSHMLTPLWFIPVIALFYLAAPVFIAVDRRPASYWAIPFLVAIAMFIHRPLSHRLIWQSAIYCLPAYLIGCWASHYREPLLDWLSRHRRWVGLAFAALVMVELFVLERSGPIFSAHPFSTERGTVDVDLVAKLIASLAILELLHAYESRIPKWLLAVASAAFGIYFVHQYVIKLIQAIARRSAYPIEHRGLATFFGLWIVVTVVAYWLVRLVQRVFGKRSRWILGS
jgi:probable poly-beta-1,6-N-acetyl-D-glucosamine export protein